LGLFASSFGFALFWKAMLGFKKERDRFLLSLLWFGFVQAVQLSWMTSVRYMGPFMFGVYVFLALGLGMQFAFLSYFFKKSDFSWRKCLAISATWTIFEWMRLFFLCGFTWNPVGLLLANSSYSLQMASVFGIFGLSFWVIWVNLHALKAIEEKTFKQVGIWAAFAIFPYLFGMVHQKVVEKFSGPAAQIDVALVQTGLYPEEKDFFEENKNAYIPPLDQWNRILSVLDPRKKVDLIVLPEAALPLGAHKAGYRLSAVQQYFPDRLPGLVRPFALLQEGEWKVSNVFLAQSLANKHQAHVIVGLDDHDFSGKYNAAFHFSPGLSVYDRYEKRVLVPMGEYIPLGEWRLLSQFLEKTFGIYGSFNAGKQAKVFQAKLPIGVSICFEETFSHLIREMKQKGAKLFVNLTNDVWFPGSKLPQQHFDHGRVRAVENGVCILRACNTGVTGWIDCFGRVGETLPVNEKQPSVLYAKVLAKSYPTLYSFWGDWAILTLSSLFLLLNTFSRKKKLL
jgi:apolipoprotein N-acyltransferase